MCRARVRRHRPGTRGLRLASPVHRLRRSRRHPRPRLRPRDGEVPGAPRARRLGATRTDVGEGDVPGVVLADLVGNEFCALGRG
ncbi:VOC family protein [Streptomyces coelicoflavus]